MFIPYGYCRFSCYKTDQQLLKLFFLVFNSKPILFINELETNNQLSSNTEASKQVLTSDCTGCN